MITIYVPGDVDIEGALKLLKKAITQDGILKETLDRRYFRSNRQKQRLKEARCLARRRRAQERQARAESKR